MDASLTDRVPPAVRLAVLADATLGFAIFLAPLVAGAPAPVCACAGAIATAFVLLARAVGQRRLEGYLAQSALIALAILAMARELWPFGLAPAAALALGWCSPRVRRHFELGEPGAPDTGSGIRICMSALAISCALWVFQRGAPIVGGPDPGWLAPLAGRPAAPALACALVCLAWGLWRGERWAYALGPLVLTPALVSVVPLGRLALGLSPVWLLPAVAGALGGNELARWQRTAVIAPAMVGLAVLMHWLPAGRCARHGVPLAVYGWREASRLTGTAPSPADTGKDWDTPKATCPVAEMAVGCRDQQRRCMDARRAAAAAMRAGRSAELADCPFDRALREQLGESALPANRMTIRWDGARLEIACRTCRDYGLPVIDLPERTLSRGPVPARPAAAAMCEATGNGERSPRSAQR